MEIINRWIEIDGEQQYIEIKRSPTICRYLLGVVVNILVLVKTIITVM